MNRSGRFISRSGCSRAHLPKAYFTVREAARFASGAALLEDYREVGGVFVPHRITIVADPSKAGDDFIHQMILKNVSWLDAYESKAP